MKMINKLIVVLGLASALVGCGNPEMLSSSEIKWEPVASEYLNKHLGKPNGAQSEWKLEVKDVDGIQIVSVFIDGQKAAWTLCNPTNGVADKSASPVCDVVLHNAVNAIHWDASSGYRVGSAAKGRIYSNYDVAGREAVELIDGLRPIFKAEGVIL